MIKVHEHSGGVKLELISRQPMVYLDQWALYRLATKRQLQSRFLNILKTRGTVLFSWVNVAEMATTSSDTGLRIKAFLHSVGENWLPLEADPYEVLQKEETWKSGTPTPCLDESFVKQYYPYIHGEELTLGKIVDLVAGQTDDAKKRLNSLKDLVLDSVQKMRAREKAAPGWAARTYPEEPFNPAKPTRFIYNAMFRELATNKGWTLAANDGVDLFHCIVAAAYSDIVLLDEPWTKRVRALGLPTKLVHAYYEGDLDEFFEVFEKGTIEVPPRSITKGSPGKFLVWVAIALASALVARLNGSAAVGISERELQLAKLELATRIHRTRRKPLAARCSG